MTIVAQQETISEASGPWSRTVPFDQFNLPAGESLGAVFTTVGSIDASAAIENLSPAVASVSLGVIANITASSPGLGTLAALNPEASASVDLGGFQGSFDGTLNFAGPSGTVLPDFAASQTETSVPALGTAGASPVIGTGTFDVSVSSQATSTVSGNGNLAVLLHAAEGASLSLQYDVTSANGGPSQYPPGSAGVADVLAPISIGFANCVTTAPQVVSFAAQTSGWQDTADFAQFDPSLGTLVAIDLNVGNTLAGTFSAENLDAEAGQVSMTETASLCVTIPGSTIPLTATAATGDSRGLAAFDGAIDFAGASGEADRIVGTTSWVNGVGVSVPITTTPTQDIMVDPGQVAAFSGTGTIALPIATTGPSTVTGPADLLAAITQLTGGTVSVSYIYEPAAADPAPGEIVPLPAAPGPPGPPIPAQVSASDLTMPVAPAGTSQPTWAAPTVTGSVDAPPPGDGGSSTPTPPVSPTPPPALTPPANATPTPPATDSPVVVPPTGDGTTTSTSGDGSTPPVPSIAPFNPDGIWNSAAWHVTLPPISFIGGVMPGVEINALSNQTFRVGAGATGTISGFSPVDGDRLDLSGLLNGALLAPNLFNLGSYVNINGQQPDPNGGVDSHLQVTGPGGGAVLTLVTTSSITVAGLLSANALVLPSN